MTRPGPPRFVPTLTEIVQPCPLPKTPLSAGISVPLADDHEAMIQRILQRVDLELEARLGDIVRELVLAQTQALTPMLREEIERLVRESVGQAFAQESGSVTNLPEDCIHK